MRIVAVARVFPNRLEPLEGPFNRQQFRALGAHAGEPVHVLHAVPHLPFARALGRPARPALLASLPDEDVIDGMPVTTLRHGYLPRVGLPVALPLFELALRRHREQLARADVVLGSWAFPDGCATVRAAHALGKPCVVKVHGSDVNVVAKHAVAARAIARDLARAEAIVVMAKSLGRSLEALGVPGDRIAFVPNGIDGTRFFPASVVAARAGTELAASAPVALFIGRLEPQKGLGDLLDAWPLVRARVPGAALRLVGAGPLEARARATEGVAVLGTKPHDAIPGELHLANVFVLPSWAEGMPNVVLEALACGRPVVGSAVGGIPDALVHETAGTVVPPKDPQRLAEALVQRLTTPSDAEAVSAFGPPSWDESGRLLCEVLDRARATRRRSSDAR